jgi:hypothetical protein
VATLSPLELQRLGTVRPELRAQLLQLKDDALAQIGFQLELNADGGQRSTARQTQLYNDALEQGGGTDTAYAVAKPGHSRHELGAAFDVSIIAGGSAADGTGTDDDYRALADLGEANGLVAGYYFAARGVGKKDVYHFQLNEPFQTSVDQWAALTSATTARNVAIGVLAVVAIGALAKRFFG